jgi:misacylated tRNA(Ala) deacylase
MPVEALYRDDFYLSTAEAVVTAIHEDGGIELDRTCFYAASGGQPGDTGFLERADGTKIQLGQTRHGATKDIVLHVPLEGEAQPLVGENLVMHIDWQRRYKLMRMHTACHLLSVVCQYPITGAAVGEEESRVDFDMTDTIGENSSVDSQPCGGTHVSETQEVGAIHIAKIEKKGKENRRFRIRFGEPGAEA